MNSIAVIAETAASVIPAVIEFASHIASFCMGNEARMRATDEWNRYV